MTVRLSGRLAWLNWSFTQFAQLGTVRVSSRSESKASSPLNSRLLLAVLAPTMSTTATSGEPAKPRDVRLVVTDSGQYILSGKPVALADLRARLRDLKSSGAPIDLHHAGDADRAGRGTWQGGPADGPTDRTRFGSLGLSASCAASSIADRPEFAPQCRVVPMPASATLGDDARLDPEEVF